MLYLSVEVECGKNFLEDKFCNGIVMKFKGSHSLQEAQHLACGIGGGVINGPTCSVVSRQYMSSFIILGGFSLAILCNCVGVLLLSHYWYKKPTKQVRYWAFTFASAAPAIALSSLLAWVMYCPLVAELPRAWTASVGHIGGGLFAIKPAPGIIPYGPSALLAGLCVVLHIIQWALWPLWFVPHPREEEMEHQEE